jgi:hypothetical protein
LTGKYCPSKWWEICGGQVLPDKMGEDNERASTARQNGWKTVTGKHCPTKWFEVLSGQSPATPCGWSARQK